MYATFECVISKAGLAETGDMTHLIPLVCPAFLGHLSWISRRIRESINEQHKRVQEGMQERGKSGLRWFGGINEWWEAYRFRGGYGWFRLSGQCFATLCPKSSSQQTSRTGRLLWC